MIGLTVLSLLNVAIAEYTERLDVTPLSRNEIMSTFTFDISQPDTLLRSSMQEYDVFPRTLGQILMRSNTQELHLRFGQGSWDARKWGSLPENGTQSGGIGVELWAYVDGPEPEDARQNWHKLVHSLGGYFCASINFINDATTTWPSPDILVPRGKFVGSDPTYVLRGALPAEPICTENLTPFLKLLPCRGKAGIASLLDGHTLFAARWQSMSVDVWRTENNEIHLRQQIISVHDTERAVSELPYPVPVDELHCDTSKEWANGWTCLPLPKQDAYYRLETIFGSKIAGRCPAATQPTIVTVHAPQEQWVVNESSEDREFEILDDEFDLQLVASEAKVANEMPPLLVDRSISGWGQQKGGVRTTFSNIGSSPLTVKYLDTLPWFMRLYLHTTKTKGEGELLDTRYIPSKDRSRPSQLEFHILIPPNANLELEYSFDRSLLFLEEYPPDANHGFEVPPGLAVATIEQGVRYEVRTPSLLLSLPVPDFSMPYNVIILTSTVMALAFGTIYNLVDRVVCPEDKVPPRQKLIDRLLSKFK